MSAPPGSWSSVRHAVTRRVWHVRVRHLEQLLVGGHRDRVWLRAAGPGPVAEILRGAGRHPHLAAGVALAVVLDEDPGRHQGLDRHLAVHDRHQQHGVGRDGSTKH